MRCRLADSVLLCLLLVGSTAGCLGHRAGWGRGSYRRIHESDRLQIRVDQAVVDAEARRIYIGWIGARATPGSPLIEEFEVVFWDDLDHDGYPDDDEVAEATTVRETTTKVMFSGIEIPYADRLETVTGRASVWTEDGELVVRVWQVAMEDD